MTAVLAVRADSVDVDWWLSTLRVAIRDEFAVDRYVAQPGELLFGAEECLVEDCGYPAYRTAVGLCCGHGRQFDKSPAHDVDDWLSRPSGQGGPAPKRTRRKVVKCMIAACPRSADCAGLCAGHHQRWARQRPKGVSHEQFVATTSPTFQPPFETPPAPPTGSCAIPSCEFPRRPSCELCDHHHGQFRSRQGSRDSAYTLDDFAVWVQQPGLPVYSFVGFGSPLREELQFALQCRSDERRAAIDKDAFPAIRRLLSGVDESLLERDLADPIFHAAHAGRFLSYARCRLEYLRDSAEGVSEWDRDVWRIDRLPGIEVRGCTSKLLSFEFCQTPWLRQVVKRWVRWRLSTGVGVTRTATDLRSLRLFVTFTEGRTAPMRSPELITRPLLEDFLAHVTAVRATVLSRNQTLGTVRLFLADCRRHDWMPGLDPRATYYRSDYGRRPEQLPRFLSEHVMAQVEDEANLLRLPSATSRTLVEVLIGTGLRARDALGLELDALSQDSAGAPYLRYLNHKLARERYIPISETLAARIRAQQTHVRSRFPACRHLLPREQGNPDGTQPFSYNTLVSQLRTWERVCEIREADGTPAHVTAHRFRHTLATRMINNGVPEVAVQQMLDHSSPVMTRVYARLHDSTLRDHYDRYQDRVNVQGEVVRLETDGALSDAAWAKERLARAKLTLPNGYCGRPLQAACPHPNACLTCPDFLTTREHLPAHRDQLASTISLIDSSRAAGHERLAEQNEQIKLNLTRIIQGLEALPAEDGPDGD